MPNPLLRFTARETQIMKLLAEGVTQRAAAETLGLSYHTIKTNISNINRKLQARGDGETIPTPLRIATDRVRQLVLTIREIHQIAHQGDEVRRRTSATLELDWVKKITMPGGV